MTREKNASSISRVVEYHDRTKHDFRRSARGPGYMDWANQPDPFRRFDGARSFLLPFDDADPATQYEDVFASVSAQPVSAQTLGWFLEWSLAVSATKSAGGTSWKLRCNPSSGNLHPTEGYLILDSIDQILDQPGIYHYRSDLHALELRSALSANAWKLASASFPENSFFIGLSSIQWRESWKYGERALRYCNQDVGHAIGALRFAAAALGWQCIMLDELATTDVAALLGLDRDADFGTAEREHADVVLAVAPVRETVQGRIPSEAIAAATSGTWHGRANVLSNETVDWSIIAETASICEKPATNAAPFLATNRVNATLSPIRRPLDKSAARIFRQRRSAVDMDGVTGMSRDDFYRTLARTLPRATRPPFDGWPYAPEVHLGLFVHRVEGLTPGAYALIRNATHLDAVRNAMRTEFVWSTPPECPEELPLYHLAPGNCQGLAAQVSCTQEIAGAGAFSLGMIARFADALAERGAWVYPRLFWEAGLIGQLLYLEAEASGLRATGIGCYFDDPVHRIFGLEGHTFQSMYHFTVGGPVDDPRLTNLPPYAPERRAQRGWV